MEVSVFSPILAGYSLDKALEYLNSLGVHSMELGVGGYPGTAHADAKELIKSDAKLNELKETFNKYGAKICALSVHGNAVHPNKDIAAAFEEDFRAACVLCGKLGVKTLVSFSGCPGDAPNATYPNWVTCPWPEDFLKVLDYQWNDVLIPYWKNAVKFAREAGVTKIALEMHPGFCVYNPETLLKLRAAVGDTIGANFDPSHLIWQGIDVAYALRKMGDSVYHFHAKDTRIDSYNTAMNGVLDTKHYTDEARRSWIFRSVGYGSDPLKWKDMMSALNLIGYKGAVSIEHEDSLMSPNEGLEKAIAFMQHVLIKEPKPSTIGWA